MIKLKACLVSIFCCIAIITTAQPDTTAQPTKKEKNVSVVALPQLSFNRSRGVGIGAMGMLFFKLSDNKLTPPSQIMAFGTYSTKGNWMGFGMARLYFNKDNYRLNVGGGYVNSNFQTYTDIGGNGNVEIPYNNRGAFAFLSPMIRVYNKLYVGIGASIYKYELDFDLPDGTTQKTNKYMNGLGASATFDTKNNPYNPSKGIFTSLRYNNYPTWFKNDTTFNKIAFQTNYYWQIDSTMILASRASIEAGIGDNVPFIAQSFVGGRDIRGYTKGEYRGNQVYAIQSEFRWNFYKRWGAVAFFGLALANSPDYTSPILPGGGIGARFKVIPKYNINIGVDGALGRNDWGLYFRITEAF